MPTTRVNFRLPDGLLERADLAAAVTGETRTGVVTDALVRHLAALEADEAFEAALVEAYFDGDVAFEALARVVGRRDAAAVRASAALLDDGESIAAALAEDGQ